MTALLEVKDLEKSYRVSSGFWSSNAVDVKALRGVSLAIEAGETLGLVGESGCGKSTLARCILRLLTPEQGQVRFEGENLLALSPRELRKRRRHFQMIFQDPYSSLNPRMTIRQMIEEPLRIHGIAKGDALRRAVDDLLQSVGLQAEMAERYPHEFSGGQRQRIGIARALALKPKLIVADEPVSALDVSVQAQILNLLQDLKASNGLSYLLIAHDLKVVERLSDRIAVMYFGKIVESGPAAQVVKTPLHPYTQALVSAVPVIRGLEPERKRLLVKGDVPSLRHPPGGCAFHPRCPLAVERCSKEVPPLEEKKPGHWAACFMV